MARIRHPWSVRVNTESSAVTLLTGRPLNVPAVSDVENTRSTGFQRRPHSAAR